MKKYTNITKSKLNTLYWNKQLSASQIGNILGCSANKILLSMHEYNIARRDSITARRLRIRDKKHNKNYCNKCGKEISYNANLCKSCYNKSCGEISGNYIDGRTTKLGICIDCGKYTSAGAEIRGLKRCRSCANRVSGLKRWQDEEYRQKQIQASFDGLNVKQNKIEKRLEKVLCKLFPDEYSFVGDGKLFIAGFVPDFININGQKKIIELFGDYWHNLDSHKITDKNRLKTYKKYGYKTLIVWEHELKDFDSLELKLINYNNS